MQAKEVTGLKANHRGFNVYRSALWAALLAVDIPVSLCAQTPSPSGADSIISYFTGKQVVAKIDMPGTQKGIDLRFNKPAPMDWKEYSSHIKQFGPAIRKGDVVRITTIVVKKDMIGSRSTEAASAPSETTPLRQ